MGLGEAEEGEHGGGDIAQAAAGAEDAVGGVGVWVQVWGDQQEGYRVGGVGSVGAAGEWVDEHLGVAVVGGDEPVGAALLDGLVDASELGVYGFDGTDGGFEFAGVSDHVGVGKVDDDDVEGGVVDGLDDGVGDAGSGHLGGEVVGGDLLRSDEDAVFSGEGFFDAAVEEVGDVGVFFGLGDAEVAEIGVGHDVGEEVIHALRGDDDGELEVLVVLGHADVVEVFGDGVEGDLGVEFESLGEIVSLAADGIGGEAGVAGEDAGDLADAICAVVEVDDDIFVADEADGVALLVGAGEGRDELVGDAAVVKVLDAVGGVGVDAAFGMAGDHGVEGLFFFFPAEVAVHGVVASADAGEVADADLLELLLQLLEVAEAAVGHGVTAVHEGMDEDAREFVLGGQAEECVEMTLVGVDATVGEQANEVEAAAFLPSQLAGTGEGGVGKEGAVGDGGVDAGHVHADDASGADIEVAYLGVAHLAVGEADEVIAGVEEGVGEGGEKVVIDRLAGECDGITFGPGRVAPAVEDGEYDWFRHKLRTG